MPWLHRLLLIICRTRRRLVSRLILLLIPDVRGRSALLQAQELSTTRRDQHAWLHSSAELLGGDGRWAGGSPAQVRHQRLPFACVLTCFPRPFASCVDGRVTAVCFR